MVSIERRNKKTADLSSLSSNADEANTNQLSLNYLNNAGTDDLLKKALNILLEQKPDDPIKFLVDYFDVSKRDPIKDSQRKLSCCHYTDSWYQRTILEVYNDLNTLSGNKSHLKGLLGVQFNKLIELLTKDIINNYSQICNDKLSCRPNQVISFNRFYRSILLTHTMSDFILLVTDIFNDLDFEKKGAASKTLCDIFLRSLKHFQHSKSMEIPDLLDTLKKSLKEKSHTTADEFVEKAVIIFLESV